MVMNERISRLMDGELEGVEAETAFRELHQHPDGLMTWACYHIVGDTLRRSGAPIAGFSERFAARLSAEPTVLAPKPRQVHRLPFAWAAVATVAAVSVVGWVAVSTLDPQPKVMAKAREVLSARAPRLSAQQVSPDYLIAH